MCVRALSVLALTALLCCAASAQPVIGEPAGSATSCPAIRTDWRLELKGGAGDTGLWSDACDASVSADFAARDLYPQWYGEYACYINSWGPQPVVFPSTYAPGNCGALSWYQQRLLASVQNTISKGYNFCNHYVPGWVPPDDSKSATPFFRSPLDPCKIALPFEQPPIPTPTSPQNITVSWPGTCSTAGLSGTLPWQGMNAAAFSSWVYNFAFGVRITPTLADQACGPNAPGRALRTTTDSLEDLLPGDLIFIAKQGGVTPLEVSHVAVWTGAVATDNDGPFNINNLIDNAPECQRDEIRRYVAERQSSDSPIYVIADSYNAGPNYRIFGGWYVSAFSHARRLIAPDGSLPRFHSSTTFTKSGGCTNVPKAKKAKSVRFARVIQPVEQDA